MTTIAIVGSRKVPLAEWTATWQFSYKLTLMGFTIVSGGADGMDKAGEEGSLAAGGEPIIFRPNHCTPESMAIAAQFHPAWSKLGDYVRKLHGRNTLQILGADLKTPVIGVICWTPDGARNHSERSIRTGGTGTAISIASHYGVPVSNLKRQSEWNTWMEWLKDPKYSIPTP